MVIFLVLKLNTRTHGFAQMVHSCAMLHRLCRFFTASCENGVRTHCREQPGETYPAVRGMTTSPVEAHAQHPCVVWTRRARTGYVGEELEMAGEEWEEAGEEYLAPEGLQA